MVIANSSSKFYDITKKIDNLVNFMFNQISENNESPRDLFMTEKKYCYGIENHYLWSKSTSSEHFTTKLMYIVFYKDVSFWSE